MSKIKDLSGRSFGRLKVISLSHTANKRAFWNCLCECGAEKKVQTSYLLSGDTKSCGCLKRDFAGTHSITHNDSHSKEHNTWFNIKIRCNNVNHRYYSHYGGRGIKVCQRWMNSYEDFLSDMGRAPSPKHSIDRINNDGDYEPSNCRWATQIEQTNNTRQNRLIEFNGRTMTIAQWCREFNLPYFATRWKINHGYDLNKVLSFSNPQSKGNPDHQTDTHEPPMTI